MNSFNINAEYYNIDLKNIFIPLAERLDNIQKRAGRRIIAYIAGPPGSGKTTASLLLELLIKNNTNNTVQAVGIDGFHHTGEYLKSNYIIKNGAEILMRDVKGSAETYNFEKLYANIAKLQTGGNIYWPGYDRVIHDVVENAVFIGNEIKIIIIEGNWLLLDELQWRELAKFCDYGVFISAGRETLIKRLTDRKIMGGLSAKDAEKFVNRSDIANIERVLNNKLSCDLDLYTQNNGKFIII